MIDTKEHDTVHLKFTHHRHVLTYKLYSDGTEVFKIGGEWEKNTPKKIDPNAFVTL